jgi:serine O-acetyltransferase
VGAGARILGGVTIGDGARIGANAVVIEDIPAGATAVGVPAKISGSRKSTKAAPPAAEMELSSDSASMVQEEV